MSKQIPQTSNFSDMLQQVNKYCIKHFHDVIILFASLVIDLSVKFL